MTEKTRVIVWGPGLVGNALIREIARKPELELVAVLAYSDEKSGKDAGLLAGAGREVGVAATTDQEAVIAMDADCVLFCPRVSAACDIDSEATEIVCRLLESGKNVVTSIGYWFPQTHSEDLLEKLETACQKGRTSLHGTGVNPGWLNERVVVALTGASTSISSIQVQEFNDNTKIESLDMLQAIGYGMPMGSTPWMENVGDRGYTESVALTCALLGTKPDEIVSDKVYFPAKKTHELAVMTIPAGTIAGLMYTYTAVVDGQPFFSLQEIWYIDPEDVPIPVSDAGDYYNIVIEGQPVSIRAQFELMASVKDEVRFRDGDHTLPAYYATAVPMIQTIPVVCQHEPGLVYPTSFANYTPTVRVPSIEG